MNEINVFATSLLSNVSPKWALLIFMLIFTRWLVLTLTVPFLGSIMLPSIMRVLLAALLAAVTWMIVITTLPENNDLHIGFIVLLFIKEAMIGFIFGFLASLIFYAYELGGELIDLARAASMSRLLVPEVKHMSSTAGLLFFQLALVLFLGFGLHRIVLDGIFSSFMVFEVTSLTNIVADQSILHITVSILSALFQIALKISLPIIAVSLVIDLAFGLLNRIAPQINAYFLSLPAKMVGGLIIVFLALPVVIDDFIEHAQTLLKYFHALH